MDPSLKSHSCGDSLLEPQDFTSLKVTAVFSLRKKDFSSWIPVVTDSPQICSSAGDFRVLYTELFSCSHTLAISASQVFVIPFQAGIVPFLRYAYEVREMHVT